MKKIFVAVSFAAFLLLILHPISRQVYASTVNQSVFSLAEGPIPPCPGCVTNAVSTASRYTLSEGPLPPCTG